jgi:hypothetical protein
MTQHDEGLLAIANALNRIADAIEEHTARLTKTEQENSAFREGLCKRLMVDDDDDAPPTRPS